MTGEREMFYIASDGADVTCGGLVVVEDCSRSWRQEPEMPVCRRWKGWTASWLEEVDRSHNNWTPLSLITVTKYTPITAEQGAWQSSDYSPQSLFIRS